MKKIAVTLLLLTVALFCIFSSESRSCIWYEIFVGSFYDSDGDGMGDLNGITAKLDYIQSLGAEGIWLMPISPSPSYHKYDVTDYRAIAPEYGTLEDYENLCTEAHKRGMKVIIDLVLNHSSKEHPWFLSACETLLSGNDPSSNPYCGYYNFTDQIAGSGYSFIQGSDKWMYEAGFGGHMPDLNLDNEGLREEILDICRFWLDLGTDGFRLDAVLHFFVGSTAKNVEFLSWLCGNMKAINPDFFVVGEAWTDGANILQYYESKIDSLFNFPLGNATGSIISAVKGGRGQGLSTVLDAWYAQLPDGKIDAPFLTNHDMARSASALVKLEREKMAADIYLLLPGSPFIYYGEEIGMKGGAQSDPDKRTQFWWSYTDETGMCDAPKEATDVRKVDQAADEQLKDSSSLLRHYMEVGRIRKEFSSFFDGTFTLVPSEEKGICAYILTDETGRQMMVVHNLGTEAASLDVGKNWKIAEKLSCLGNGKGIKLKKGVLTLEAMSTVVLK